MQTSSLLYSLVFCYSNINVCNFLERILSRRRATYCQDGNRGGLKRHSVQSQKGDGLVKYTRSKCTHGSTESQQTLQIRSDMPHYAKDWRRYDNSCCLFLGPKYGWKLYGTLGKQHYLLHRDGVWRCYLSVCHQI